MIESAVLAGDGIDLMQSAEFMSRRLDRDEFISHLDTLLVLLSDLFRLRFGEPADSLTNPDAADRLRPLAEVLPVDQIEKWVTQIEAILQALPRNINRNIAMDAMLTQLGAKF